MSSRRRETLETHAPPRRWRELYSALADLAPGSVFAADAGGRIVHASSALCLRVGRARADLLARSLTDLFPDCNLLGTTTVTVPMRVRRGQADEIVDAVVATRALPDGGLVGLVNDAPGKAAASQAAEAAAVEAEQRLRLLTDAAFEGIAITRQGVFLDLNNQFAAMTGYTRDELLNTPVLRCVAPEDRQRVDLYMGSGRVEPYEHLALRKDGTTFPVESRARWGRAGEQEVRVMAIRDISDRKQAEAALQALRYRDQEALRIARMGHWEYDIAAGVFTFNDQYYSLHGTTAAEAGGYQMPAEEFAGKYVHPDDAHTVAERIQLAVQTTDPDFQFQAESRILHADGQPRDVAIWFQVEKDARGRTVRLRGVSQDITDRRRLERETERRRLFLESVLAFAPDAIVIGDKQHTILEWNRGAERLFGYTAEEARGRHIDDLITGGSASTHAEAVRWTREIQQSEGIFSAETVRFRRDGTPVNVRLSVGQRLSGGERVGVVAVYTDISESKKAEKDLRLSEERFRSTFENSLVGVSLIALDGRYLMVNPAYSAIFGYTAAELLNTSFLSLTHPDDVELSRKAMQTVLTGPEHHIRLIKRYLHKDGHTLWADVSVGLVRGVDGTPLYYVTHVNDITEKKLAEDALRAMRDELVIVTDSVPMLIGHVSPDERYQFVNEAYARFFGRSKESIAGAGVSQLLDERNYAVARPFIRRVLNGEPVDYENVVENVEGGPRTVWVHNTPHRDETGRVIGYFNLTQDITDRKQAELLIREQKERLEAQNEQLAAQNEELVTQGRALAAAEAELRQTNDQLEERIRARSAELRAANEELQLANAALLRAGRMKDEFLANMSHELRTPLTGILGLAEVLEKGFYGELTERQRGAMAMMQDSGEHLLQLINDILDLSKVEAGRVDLQIAPVLVDEVCQASLQFIRQSALKKNLQVRLRLDPDVRAVLADGRRLKQMLVNLLSNAVKFTPEGGRVELEIDHTVGPDAALERVLFRVRDSGIGISPESQPLLFKPFVQLDGSLSRRYEGTGLGLALVRAMAELHGGTVTVESAGFGQGSCFTVALPWTTEVLLGGMPDIEPAMPGSDSLAATLGRKPRLIVVDDNLVTLAMLSTFLHALGAEVTTLQDGALALEALERKTADPKPDLALLDVQMPGVDGLTIIRRTRAAGSKVAIIVLTALAMPGDRERCLEAGADDYLSKPVKLADLEQVVRRLLREHGPEGDRAPAAA